MGVLACSRSDCDNIMCELISDEYGYICNECFEELKEFLVYRGTVNDTEGNCLIKEFMESPKTHERSSSLAGKMEDFLSEIFSNVCDKLEEYNEWKNNWKDGEGELD